MMIEELQRQLAESQKWVEEWKQEANSLSTQLGKERAAVARLKSLVLQAGDHEADLCEALEKLLKGFHGGYNDGLWHGPQVTKARAALAKARGEQA
jgi:arginine deiminase